jgi:hypothetical protein
MKKKDNSCKQDILTDISVYIYRFTFRYTVLLYTTCTDELYICVHNSYKQDTHTHTDISLYKYRFLYRYTVLHLHLVQMECTCVYTTAYCCITWHALNIQLWCTHYARISYTAVHLYCPFSVNSGPVLLCIQLHCTTVHALVPAWPLFFQPITEEL